MESWTQFLNFTEICAVYFTLQLVRCVLFSYLLIGIVMLLRRSLFSKATFARGMLWALFLLVPFMGKLKLFYENALAVKATWRLTDGIMAYPWLAYAYMAGVTLSFLYVFAKRVRLQRAVSRMKKRVVKGRTVRITDMKVTPFTAGLFRPQIVLPEVMAGSYGTDELNDVIRHERTHIRLGHLWCYLAWDILRCLLWLNPFLGCCQRYFRADMEDICDRVCIQGSGKTAQEYGQLLIKTLKLLRTGQDDISSAAAYAGEKDFEDIKRRMTRIAAFRPYRKIVCRSGAIMAAALFGFAFMGINSISYARCSELDDILVYEYDSRNGEATVLENGDCLQQMISYDENYVYVDRAAFETFLSGNHAEGEIHIVFGGYQKLPGIGGGGRECFYQADTDEKIAKIPYEKAKDGWMAALLKIL